MDVTRLMPVGLLLISAFSGCASTPMEAIRPEPRPLGQQLPAFQAPEGLQATLSHEPQPEEPTGTLTRYPLTAPFEGSVIEKHVTLGEVVKDDTVAYVIADLRSVWVNVSVYPKDLPLVLQGQPVRITAGHGMPDAQGSIAYVAPAVDEQTRTALARVVLPNPNGAWRPGLFVTARIEVGTTDVPLLIPQDAVQTVEGKATVFVHTTEGFEARPVSLGRANETHVEVLSGLEAGERYAATETFTLKAELTKGEATHQH